MIVPILAFFSSLVKGRASQILQQSLIDQPAATVVSSGAATGLSGMGEALVYGAGWQLFYLAGFEVPSIASIWGQEMSSKALAPSSCWINIVCRKQKTTG